MGVSTIDDNVARVAVWEQLLDKVVNGWASHNKQHHSSRLLQLLGELLDRVGPND